MSVYINSYFKKVLIDVCAMHTHLPPHFVNDENLSSFNPNFQLTKKVVVHSPENKLILPEPKYPEYLCLI